MASKIASHPATGQVARRFEMLDVTYKIEAAKIHHPSGITYVKTVGDKDYEWVVSGHNVPEGYTAIAGQNNGSHRMVTTVALNAVLKNAWPFKND
jgi:hypothetical protein